MPGEHIQKWINMNLKRTLLIILFIQLPFVAKAQYQTNISVIGSDYYINPIFAGDYPDPSILKDGDNYYIVHSSFEYYPGLLIWQSKDLINWNPVTNALHKYACSSTSSEGNAPHAADS